MNNILDLCKQIIENEFPIFTTKPERVHEAFYLDKERKDSIVLRCDMFYYIVTISTNSATKLSYKEFSRLYPEFDTEEVLTSIPSYMIEPIISYERNYRQPTEEIDDDYDEIIFPANHADRTSYRNDLVFDDVNSYNTRANNNSNARRVRGF